MTEYLDDLAFRDTATLPSAIARKVRRVAKDAHDNRRPVVGWGTPDGKPIRLCAIEPGFVIVDLLRLPKGDTVRSVDVHLKANAVELANATNGTAAVRIQFTASNFTGPIIRPSLRVDDWTEYDKADTIDAVFSVPTPLGQRDRWCVVLLWVWSLAHDTAEGVGTCDVVVSGDPPYEPIGGFRYNSTLTSGSAPASNPPERALVVGTDPLSKPDLVNLGGGNVPFLVEYHDAAGYRMWLNRPMASYMATTAFQWSTYPIGVLPVTSCVVLGSAGEFAAPAERAYRTGQLVDQRTLMLADWVDSKVNGYMPHAWGDAGIGDFSGAHSLWPMRVGTPHTSGHNERVYRSALAGEFSATNNGWIAVAAFAAFAHTPVTRTIDELYMQARLAAWAIGDDPDSDTPFATGDWLDVSLPMNRPLAADSGFDSRLAHTLWGAGYFDSWQSRGVMYTGDHGQSQDWAGLLGKVELTIGAIAAPVYRLGIQLKLKASAHDGYYDGASQIALIASACAARDLDE